MSDHGHNAIFPIIWAIKNKSGAVIGHTIQMTEQLAKVDANNRFKNNWKSIEDTGKRKVPNKCCSKCGDKPCS